jgi:hypothetical protein
MNLPIRVILLLEDIAVSGIFVATVFDADMIELCESAHPCPDCAVQACLSQLPRGRYDVEVRELNPNDEE